MPQHCDPNLLDQAALGTVALSETDLQHVAECEECAETLTAMGQVAATARGAAGMELVEPPASVWTGITDAIHQDSGSAGDAAVVSFTDRRGSSRGWTRWAPLVAAAAAGVLLGGILTALVTVDRQPKTPSPQVVATADLTPLPGRPVDPQAAGSAVLKQTTGQDVLVLHTSGLPEPTGYYEVWLMDPKTAGLISIGTVPGGDQLTTFKLPAGVRLDRFSVVDISAEPMDGNPAHSTVSVLRGQLQA